MRNIKLTIEYDGKRYLGWQRLGDNDKTIQEKIEGVIKLLTNEDIEIIGSGRMQAPMPADKSQISRQLSPCR